MKMVFRQELNHFDENGQAVMVDVSAKEITARQATACGKIFVSREIITRIKSGKIAKGDVLGVARIAGIMGAKRTSELIPLCHPLPLTECSLDFSFEENADACAVCAFCTVKTKSRTGVEMEALTGVSTALLTIYDMCKAVDKSMYLADIHLMTKSGGRSGDFRWQSK